MMVASNASGLAAEGALGVSEALVEPALVAAGWMDAPPWALLAIVALTMVLFAFANREPQPVVE